MQLLGASLPDRAKLGAKNTDDVAAEVQDYGQFSTDLDNGGEGARESGPNIRSPTMRICALEGNRQVFGQCLHQSQESLEGIP